MSRRQVFEEKFLGYLQALPLAPRNIDLYTEKFKSMSDDDFHAMVVSIMDGNFVLPAFSYNMEGTKADTETIMRIGEELGVKFFQRLTLTDPVTREAIITPEEYLVLNLQVRRQIQHLVKKRSTPSSTRVIDHLTGQVTGDSKGASMSLPELTALNAKGHEAGIIELIKPRGGDAKAYANLMQQIRDTGGYSLAPIMELGSRPKVIETTNSFFAGMMLRSTL